MYKRQGLGWIGFGLLGYAAYRRYAVRAPLRATVKAPVAYGPALALEYRRLLVPVLPGRASDEALDVAASLSAERGAQIVAVCVLEVPLDVPLDVDLAVEEEVANRELDEHIANVVAALQPIARELGLRTAADLSLIHI